jgi:catechol 2,3-dioxygenase-like lactoylglutathione lyase family enzyme
MKIALTSIMVDDQDKALQFYTEVLGFIKKQDIPMGGPRWLTVVSPDKSNDVELLLEPDWNPNIQIDGKPAAQVFKKTLVEAGIPYTSFAVEDIQKEYERLEQSGVKFTMGPTKMGPVTVAVFNDSCGNLIQIAQK